MHAYFALIVLYLSVLSLEKAIASNGIDVTVIDQTTIFIRNNNYHQQIASPTASNTAKKTTISTALVPGQIQQLSFQHCLPYSIHNHSSHTVAINLQQSCAQSIGQTSHDPTRNALNIEQLLVDSSVRQNAQLIVRGILSWQHLDPDQFAQLNCAYGQSSSDSSFNEIYRRTYHFSNSLSGSIPFTFIHDLTTGFTCVEQAPYTVTCTAILQYPNDSEVRIGKNGCLLLDEIDNKENERWVQRENYFNCRWTPVALSKSKLNPVDPVYIEQYKSFAVTFNGRTAPPEIFVNSAQLQRSISTLIDQSGQSNRKFVWHQYEAKVRARFRVY